MHTIRHAAVTLVLCCFFTLDARAITFDTFGPSGEGGLSNGQTLTVGVGGAVFELDAFVNIAGQDLNGPDFGTSAQLSVDPLPPGLTFSFTPVLSADATDLTLIYTFTNNTGGPLTGITLLSFLDAEIDESINTFFNEFATTSGTLAPGQNFEVDEPGFLFGDIFDNLLLGTLDGTNALPEDTPEDVSMAMSFSFTVGSIAPGETLVVKIMISEDGDAIGSFAITQHDSDPGSTTTITFSGQAFVDSTPPSVALTAINSGPPVTLEITTQDTGSGLGTIDVVQADNATVAIPPFTPGTNDPVIVIATKMNQQQSSRVVLRVTDLAGQVTTYSPIVTTLTIPPRRLSTSQTFTVPRKEHFVTVKNANTGLEALTVTVNRVGLWVIGLRDGEQRTIDIARAMVKSNNTVTLVGVGRPGDSALVVISDTSGPQSKDRQLVIVWDSKLQCDMTWMP